jgi:hypothetical protein
MAKIEDNGYPSYSNDDGSGQTGTALDEAFFNAVRDAVNTLCHNTTYTTVTPEDIIAEIEALKALKTVGSWTSLTDALDGVIDFTDGSLIAPASVVSLSQLQSNMGAKNLLMNEDMLIWGKGIAADDPPSHWGFTDDNGGSSGSCTREATTREYSPQGVKVISASTDACYNHQTVIYDTDLITSMRNQSEQFSLGCWMYVSGTAANGRIEIYDGNSTTYASPSSASAWEWVDLTHTLDGAASELTVHLKAVENVTVYFCVPTLTWSTSTPDKWIPSARAYGSIAWQHIGAPIVEDRGRWHKFARPTLVTAIHTLAKTAAGAGGLTGSLFKRTGGAQENLFSSDPMTLLGNTNAAKTVAVNGDYDHRCFEGGFDTTGAANWQGLNDAVLELNIDVADTAADVGMFVEGMQYLPAFEGISTYAQWGSQ